VVDATEDVDGNQKGRRFDRRERLGVSIIEPMKGRRRETRGKTVIVRLILFYKMMMVHSLTFSLLSSRYIYFV
tara:strand:- start:1342 stop:1560 length:219 start_codon:yes stop_codon:yes gene_type:complete